MAGLEDKSMTIRLSWFSVLSRRKLEAVALCVDAGDENPQSRREMNP